MECGSCRHQNEPTSKFCGECGSPLLARCPSCDAQQAPNLKFCTQCGTSMSGHAPTSPPAAMPAAGSAERPAAVRKDVTALFADLVGSTAFGEQVDPEAARSALAPYFEILRSSIEDHAGTVAKFTGDGVMAVFGIPEIAEDDALRAVAAGAELQRRFRNFADAVRDRHGVELGLRVGINTGELVIGDDDADLVGDVLNTAARLEAACQPGRVLVGEDTWRLTRSSVTYEVLGEVRVKGKTDAIATFQVVDDDRGTAEDATPFVGRDDELTLLLDAFEQARSSPAAKLVTVIGAPGVGKTRLAAELRAAVDARSFDLRFERRGSTTFTPIAELLRELTGSASPDDVARLVAEHPESERLTGALSSFLGYGEARSTEESFWAVRRLLEHLSTDEPLVIVVDDIQWAEPLFWDLLDHLVEWAAAPVLLLALARPELRELKPELTQPGRRVAASIPLEGLDASTTRELAARLLDTDELPGDLIDRLPASTEGNPLFIRELVQMLVDDGVLARSGDTWHLTIDVDAIEVPPTVLSLLASRVERLPDDECQVVELASVIGTEFDRGVLGSIAGDEVASRLGALIDRLRRKDLIEPSGTWAGDQPVYRFHHVLVRDAAYRRLLKAHRADLHEQVGRFLETGTGPADELDITIAHHYELVHRYRTELGTIDDATAALAAQAAARLRSAAELALEREDLVSAGGFAARAIGLSTDPDQLHELLLLGCEALLSSGDVARGAPLVDQLHEQAGDQRLGAWADCFRAELWSLTDAERLREAADLSDDAANRLAALGDNAGVAKARLVRAATLARLGRVGDCEVELDLALGAARAAGDRRRTVAVLGAAPRAALFGPSPVARAGGRCLDVLRLLRITTSSQAVEATSIRCQGMLEALRGRFDSARDKFEISRTTATELGHRQGLCETELFHGFAELLAGNPVAAEPHLRAARDGLGRLGIGADAGQASALLARSLLLQGRVDEAEELAREAVESAGQNLRTAIASRSVLAEIRAERGDFGDASRLIGEATDLVEGTDVLLEHAQMMVAAARVARAAGDLVATQAATATATELLAAKGVTTPLDGVEGIVDRAPNEQRDEQIDEPRSPASSQTSNTAWRLYEAMIDDWRAADDRDALISHFRHDFATVNRERLRPDEEPRDREFLADLFMWASSFGEFDVRTKVIDTHGDHLFLARWTITVGGELIERRLIVETDDEFIVRYDSYELDDEAAARTEFERRMAQGAGAGSDRAPDAPNALTNRAWEVAREFGRAVRDGDIEAVERLQHPDATTESRRAINALSLSQTEANQDAVNAATKATEVRLDLLAIRDDDFCLARTISREGDDTIDVLWACALSEGLMHRVVYFDPEQLDEAIRLLGQWWAAKVGPSSVLAAAGRFARCVREGDVDAVAALFVEDFIAVDRRPIGLGARTPRDLVSSGFPGVGAVHYMVDVVRYSDSVALMHVGGIDLADPDGSRVDMLCLTRSEGELLTDWENFGLDQRAEAIERFHDLNGTNEQVGVASHVPEPRSNRAFAAALERQRRQLRGDRHGYESLFADDLLLRMHTRLMARDGEPLVVDRASAMDQLFFHDDMAGRGSDSNMELLATRGQSLCLFKVELISPSGDSTSVLIVDRLHEHQLSSMDVFDPGQHDEALALLDRLWTEPGPVDFDTPTGRGGFVFLDAWNAGDLERARACLAPDLVIESHRTVVTPGHTYGEEAQDALLALHEFVPTMASTPLEVRGDHLLLSRQEWTDQASMDIEMLAIMQIGPGNLIRRAATFDPGDRPGADALLDAWASEPPPADPERLRRFGNDASWEWVHGLRARAASGLANGSTNPTRLGWAYDRIDDEAELVDRSETRVHISGRDSVWAAWGELVDSGFDRTDGSVIAERGERFVLSSETLTSSDAVIERLALIETDSRGQLVRVGVFDLDQEADALEMLDDRWFRCGDDRMNRASELVRDFGISLRAAGHEAVIELIDPDAVIEFRMHLAGGRTLTREEWIDNQIAVAEQGLTTTSRVVAVAGPDLALIAASFVDEETESRRWAVVQSDGDQIVALISFDEDQLLEAREELTRRFAAVNGLDAFMTARRNVTEAAAAGQFEVALTHLHPQFSSRDLRQLGLGERDAAGWLQSIIDIIGPGSGGRSFNSEAIDFADNGVLFRHTIHTDPDAGGATWDLFSVAVMVDGLIKHWDNYDLDQLTEARARFRELTTPAGSDNGEVSNRSSQVGRRLLRAVAGGDPAEIDAVLTDDFTHSSRELSREALGVGVLDHAGYVDAVLRLRSLGELTMDSEIVAVRGEQLSVARVVIRIGDDEIQLVVVVESAGDRARSLTWFDEDRLRDALDELDRWWIELGGPAWVVEATRPVIDAFESGDRDQILASVDPRFVSIDHRPLGMGERAAEEWADSMAALEGGLMWYASDIMRVSDDIALFRYRSVLPTDGAVWDIVSLSVLQHGKAVEQHMYDFNQLDEAIAHFERRVADRQQAVGRAPLGNTATRIGDAVLAACEAQDREALERLVHDDFESDWRFAADAALGADIGDKQQYIDLAINMPDSFADPDSSLAANRRVLAVRDDHLYLGRGKAVVNGYDWEYLVLAESHDGQYRRLIWWEPDRIAEALDELDRLWIESLDGPAGPATIAASWSRWRRAVASADPDLHDQCLTPDFVDVDHRPLGKAVRERAEYLQSMTPLEGSGAELVAVDIPKWSDNVALARVSLSTDAGAAWELWAVTVYSDGLMHRNETYPIERYDDARARYAALVPSADGPPFSNTAWEITGASLEAFAQGDWDRVDQLTHPDFVQESRRPTSASAGASGFERDDQMASLKSWHDLGGAITEQPELLAIRGDRLCVFRSVTTVGDEEVPYVAIIETAGPQMLRLTTYDPGQLDDALDDLDRRWADRGGPAWWVDLTIAYRRAISQGEGQATIRSFAADGFVAVDHQAGVSLGERTADEWAASIEPLQGRCQIVLPQVVAWSDVGVSLQTSEVTTPDGSTWHDWRVITSIPDPADEDRRLFTRWETFGLADHERALERYHELVAELSVTVAADLVRRCADHLEQGDRARALDVLSPHFISVSHERLRVDDGVADREVFADQLLGYFSIDDNLSTHTEVTATKGQHTCLFLSVVSIDGNASELYGVAVTNDEHILRIDWFEPEQESSARALLATVARETTVPAPKNQASRLARVVAETWERRDVDTARSVLSPDFQLVSRKKQRVGIAVDRDGFVGLIESTTANPDGLVSKHRVIEVRGDHLVLFEATDTYGDDVVRQLSVIELADGFVLSLTLFDLDQLDEAMALLEERWDDREDLRNDIPEPDWSLRNLATIAFTERLAPVSAPAADDAAANALLREVYHEDLVYEIHRRGVHGQSGGRGAAIEGHFSWPEVGLRPIGGPIELRGDCLALLGMLFVSDDHKAEVGMWLVVEADDDERITYLGVWDDVDLDAARAELERRSSGSD